MLTAPIVAIGGAVLVAGTAAFCAINALPPKQRLPAEAAGDRIDDFSELNQFEPPLRRIGFVGASRVGKTTLLMHVVQQPAPTNTRTDDPYAVISTIVGKPAVYFALVDAAGQQFSQQFKVADESEILVVCLDHTADDHHPAISQVRLNEHAAFLTQMLGHLKTRGTMPAYTHFLLNKRDLWESNVQRSELEAWFAEQVALWSAMPGTRVTSSRHSNFKAEDTTAFIARLRDFLNMRCA